MRKELYLALAASMSQISSIKHIDLWNQNVEFLEEGNAFPMPAVFIEFGEIVWSQLKGKDLVWDGRGTVNLHIVTEWHGSNEPDSQTMAANLADWDLASQIQDRIQGMYGEHYRNVALERTLTNHNHDDIVENVEVYGVKFTRVFTSEQ